MKYEEFKLLSTEQKEEYNFRFKDRRSIDFLGIYAWTIVGVTQFMLYLVFFYLGVKDETIKSILVNTPVMNLHYMFLNFLYGMFAFIAIYLFIEIVRLLYNIYKEAKWRKANCQK